jgi:hypothetical protein
MDLPGIAIIEGYPMEAITVGNSLPVYGWQEPEVTQLSTGLPMELTAGSQALTTHRLNHFRLVIARPDGTKTERLVQLVLTDASPVTDSIHLPRIRIGTVEKSVIYRSRARRNPSVSS